MNSGVPVLAPLDPESSSQAATDCLVLVALFADAHPTSSLLPVSSRPHVHIPVGSPRIAPLSFSCPTGPPFRHPIAETDSIVIVLTKWGHF